MGEEEREMASEKLGLQAIESGSRNPGGAGLNDGEQGSADPHERSECGWIRQPKRTGERMNQIESKQREQTLDQRIISNWTKIGRTKESCKGIAERFYLEKIK